MRVSPPLRRGSIALALIPEQLIAEVRDRTDIVAVVGEHVALRRSGVNHKGLCPFHAERSPSFNVNSAKQIFHCFGCGKSGDVIRFLMEIEARPFLEVVRELARRAGVELPEPTPESPVAREARARAESDRARMLKLNRLACDFFREQYAAPSGERARRYVEERRGISSSVRDAFLLGYAPPGWRALVDFLAHKRVPHELAEAAGLVRPREGKRLPPGAPPTGDSHFDLFRDRVMFPLLSPLGEVLAFSGRALEENAPDGLRIPKYINSPETLLYRKGENLYGLHAARTAMRQAGRALLVEGNFDVLMMHERGFTETVAPMGTALTTAQVRLLHRSLPSTTSAVYMLLDGDAAGSSAAARNVGLFLDEDLLAKVATLPPGDDPDTFVARDGREALELLLAKASESVEYFCEYGWSRSGTSLIERARLLEEEAAPVLRKVKLPAARQRLAERLALTLDLPVSSVHRVLRGGPTSRQPTTALLGADDADTAAPERIAPLDAIDLELVALLADHPRLAQRLTMALPGVAHPSLREALDGLQQSTPSAVLDVRALCERLPAPLRSQAMSAAVSGRYADDALNPERALDAIVRKRQEQRAQAEFQELFAAVRAATEPEARQRLMTRLNDLQRRFPSLNQARLARKG